MSPKIAKRSGSFGKRNHKGGSQVLCEDQSKSVEFPNRDAYSHSGVTLGFLGDQPFAKGTPCDSC